MSKLLRNTSLYTIGNILPKAAGFVLLPLYTSYLSPAEYGLVTSMHALLSIMAIFFSLNLERSVIRLYWDYKTDSDRKDFLGTINVAVAFISIIFLIILFLFKDYLSLVYESISFYPYYAYTILIGFFTTFLLTPKVYLRLREKAGKYVLLSLLQFVVSSIFIIWFIIFKDEGAVGYLKGQIYGEAILSPVFLYYTFKVIGIRFKLTILKESLSFSLPIIPSMLSAWVLNLSDRIFIERYFSLEDVGIYSLGYRIASIVLIFAGAFNMAYAPTFFAIANSADQLKAKSKLFKYNNVYLIVSILVCFIISFFAKEIIFILFDARYLTAYLFVPFIALSYLISQFDGIIGYYFQQSKKMSANAVKSILVAVTNIGLNFLLIPPFGAFGAAYATILTMLVLTLFSYLYTKKYCYFISFGWKNISLVFSPLLLIIILFQYWIDLDVYLSLTIKVVIVGLISIYFLKKYYKDLLLALKVK